MERTKINIDFLKSFFKSELTKELPGMSSHKKMIPFFPDNVPEYFNYDQKLRDAAVLIVIFFDYDKLKTILIERVPDPGPHSGQIAFPGGRTEETDIDLIHTALREAEEEVGVVIKREQVLGSLTPVQIPISRYSVLPVVCFTDEVGQLIRCEDEVNRIFEVDLFSMLEKEAVRPVKARAMMIEAPSFAFDDQIVWGATAMVLKEFKDILTPFLNQ